MQLKFAAACSLVLAAASLLAQQPGASGLISGSDNRKPAETIYDPGRDVTAPLLLPSQPLQISTEKCKKKFRQKDRVQLSLAVSPGGRAEWVALLHPIGNDLDQTALDLAHADQFTPATRNGEAVAAWQSIDIDFQSCRENPSDKNLYPASRLTAQPVQQLAPPRDPHASPTSSSPETSAAAKPYKVGGGVSAPVPLLTPEAHYSLLARRKRVQGTCLVSLIVDAEGMPQNPHIVKPVGYELDEMAIQAIRH